MKAELTEQEISFYQENGYLVIEDFLAATELAEWQVVVERAMRSRLETRNGITNQHDADSFYAHVFTQCLRLADTDGDVARLVRDERLGRLAGHLEGRSAMRIWHDQALVKQPYSNPTSWHNDVPHWSFHSKSAVNFWFALDKATVANGCLWYLPGTHLMASYDLVTIGENFDGILSAYPEWRQIEAVPAECPAGSVVIHNGLTAHSSGPNITPRFRRAMTSVYFPDGEVYNGRRDTLPHYTDTLQAGDPLANDQFVPLVWQARGNH